MEDRNNCLFFHGLHHLYHWYHLHHSGSLIRKPISLQFLPQRAAIDAENIGRAHLIAFGVVEHCLEQRLFHLAQHQVVKMCGPVPVETGEVVAERTLRVGTQRKLFAVGSPVVSRREFFTSSTVSLRCHVLMPRNAVRPPLRPRRPTRRDSFLLAQTAMLCRPRT